MDIIKIYLLLKSVWTDALSLSLYHNSSGHIFMAEHRYVNIKHRPTKFDSETTKNILLEELVRCEPYFINLTDP